MAQKLLYLWMARVKPSFLALPDEERKALQAKVMESADKLGIRILAVADCTWSSSCYHVFGVEEYPSIGAIREHIEAQRKLGWLDHFEQECIVGTPLEEFPASGES